MPGQFYVLGETITKAEEYRSRPYGPFNSLLLTFHHVFGDDILIADFEDVSGRWRIDGDDYLHILIFNGGEGVPENPKL